ncbi:MAG: hypothetical protein L6290_10130 [Thermodesulfovibrionales bacterium]|nr:hypothetical protein [Thermodesulfovibrionales bacterium]
MIAAGVIAVSCAALDKLLQTRYFREDRRCVNWFIDSTGVVCALEIISIKALKKCLC